MPLTKDAKEFLKSLTVLYVEDDDDARKQVCQFLSRLVAQVITAENGVQGLKIYSSLKPDIIITDINMPVMDGLKMAAAIRDEDGSVPIIVLTAYDNCDYLMNAINTGIDTYVTKPIDQFRFQSVLRKCARQLLADKVLRDEYALLDSLVKERTAELQRSNDQLRSLANHIENLVEEERKEIAREFHDELGQLLTALKIDVSWMKKQNLSGLPTVEQKVNSMSDTLDTTIQSARRVMNGLRPMILDELGIVEAIESQLENFRNKGLDCHFESNFCESNIDKEQAVSLFRIFQEAMTNVLRHADATRVDIWLDNEAQGINLQITDNGCGMDTSLLDTVSSLGLLGMAERALRWGGTVNFEAAAGGGTTVRAELPIRLCVK